MKRSEEVFFRLLRAALNTSDDDISEITLSEEEWLDVYLLSRRQACQGVIYDAMKRLREDAGIPASHISIWERDLKRIEGTNRRIAGVREAQVRAWEKRGIRGVELKGFRVASNYPVPEHRICGDIDWWFPEEGGWEKALQAVKDNKCEMTVDSDGDIHYVVGNVIVEHHKEGFPDETPAGEIAFLSEHIAKHAMVFGVGMRQVCDYYLARKKYGEEVDPPALEKLLAQAGLTKWQEVLNSLIDNLFEGADITCPKTAKLRKMIVQDGNFGHSKRFLISGFFRRLVFFLECAPGPFFKRWAGLASGRLRRVFAHKL